MHLYTDRGIKVESENHYLTCEKNWVYYTLITISGFFGAFTYLLRGNVFCNAQTGNVVLLALKGQSNLAYACAVYRSAYLVYTRGR